MNDSLESGIEAREASTRQDSRGADCIRSPARSRLKALIMWLFCYSVLPRFVVRGLILSFRLQDA
jgi:hypothetical protein